MDFHGRDSQGKQEELHKKARMETFRIIFNVCVLKTFHMECKIEACCPYFIIATFHLLTQNLTYFLYFPSQSLAYFPPSLKSVASHRHSLAARLKPMVMDLWRLAGLLAVFHFSYIFCLHLRLCWPGHLSFFIHFLFASETLGGLFTPQRLSLSSQSMPCSRDSLVGKLRGENVLKLIMASCDENI